MPLGYCATKAQKYGLDIATFIGLLQLFAKMMEVCNPPAPTPEEKATQSKDYATKAYREPKDKKNKPDKPGHFTERSIRKLANGMLDKHPDWEEDDAREKAVDMLTDAKDMDHAALTAAYVEAAANAAAVQSHPLGVGGN